MLRYILPFILFVVIGVFLYKGLSLDPRDLGSTLIDKPAPSFSLPLMDDMTQTVSEKDFLGKVSIFNIWASWCGTCRYEHPLLMQLQQQGYIIYGLVYKDKLADAKQVLARTGNPYEANAFDEKGTVAIDWGVTGTPETFVIDKQGIVRMKHVGQITVDIWRNKFVPLINKLDK